MLLAASLAAWWIRLPGTFVFLIIIDRFLEQKWLSSSALRLLVLLGPWLPHAIKSGWSSCPGTAMHCWWCCYCCWPRCCCFSPLHWSMIATIISGSSSCKSLQVSFPTISWASYMILRRFDGAYRRPMDAIFAIALQKLVQWTLGNVHWKTFNRPIWFSGRWFLSSWYFQFTLRYSPLSLWYFQYWKSIWKQHDNDCLPLLKWDVKPLSHCCCLSCLRSFNQFSEFHQKAKLETRPCCLMFLRSASVVVTIARWHLRHRAAAEGVIRF